MDSITYCEDSLLVNLHNKNLRLIDIGTLCKGNLTIRKTSIKTVVAGFVNHFKLCNNQLLPLSCYIVRALVT